MSIPLRHGIFLAPFHSVRENPTLTLQRDLELMSVLDELGFAEAWIGEHHSAGMETIDSPEIFIAAAAERTKHIKFGTGVISLPYHHPLNVANRILQLDHMTRGRIMLGVGPGLLASDALMMGIEPETTRDRMEESLDVILRLFNGDIVTETSEWYTMREARTHLRPYSSPHPEVCVASALTPSGGRLAGKYDLGMLCVAAGVQAGFDALDVNWKVATEAAADRGKEMDRNGLRCVVGMHLAESREQAMADIRFGAQEYIDYLNNNQPRFHIPEGVDTVEWIVDNQIAVVGTADDAIARIEAIKEKQGEFGCLLLLATNWADWEATKKSYELYARYVMPHFDNSNLNRTESFDWVTAHQAELVAKRTAAAEQMTAKHQAEQAAKAGLPADTTPFEHTNEILVNVAADVLLDYVSNPQSWCEWMPATHEIRCDDRPLQLGETFSERWATRKGEVGLAWRVTDRKDGELWVAETETPFTGPIVARYEVIATGPTQCRYVRRVINPARPKAPTAEMIERMQDEAIICLDNIKRILEDKATVAV
jgi:limonene 1,2-monooxygenase